MEEYQMTAKTFKGLEEVLAKELVDLGANNVQLERRAVSFSGNKEILYKANLHLRTASRVLVTIDQFKATDPDQIYEKIKTIPWEKYMSVDTTFAVDSTVYSDIFRHSKFVAYRVKDGIADYFMERYDKRPSVRLSEPQLIVNIHIAQNQCTLSLDSSGESLHKRGYRIAQTEAPLNEALAAGMILLTGWHGECDFIDPMCGSGTLLIEAGLIALNIPPGIFRKGFAFEKWKNFDEKLYEEVYNDDSMERTFEHKIYGSDISLRAIQIAQENVKNAGLSKYVELKVSSIEKLETLPEKAVLVSNPPYGERLKSANIENLYASIGTMLKHKFAGNEAWIICSEEFLLSRIGMKPSKKIELLNGSIECLFCKYEIFSGKRNEFVASKRTKDELEFDDNRINSSSED